MSVTILFHRRSRAVSSFSGGCIGGDCGENGLWLVILPSPIVECAVRAFQNIHGRLVDRRILDTASRVFDAVPVHFVDPAANDLIRVAHDSQVGVVRDDYHLPSSAGLADAVDEQLNNRFVVEIVFGLIDDDRDFFRIEQQVKFQSSFSIPSCVPYG